MFCFISAILTKIGHVETYVIVIFQGEYDLVQNYILANFLDRALSK